MKKIKPTTFNQKMLKLIPVCIITFILAGFIIFQENSDIVGTWVDKEDPKSTWVFTSDNKLTIKYEGEPNSHYTYRLSTTSPQCGESVQTGPNLWFLELTAEDNGDQYCYYINGLNNQTLSLSYFLTGEIIVFNKQ